MSGGQVLAALHTTDRGLSRQEAAERLRVFGPNAVRTHRVRTVVVLLRQVRSPLLILLAVTALASFFLGERLDAVIIAVILLASVGLGFVNEYRAERAVRALHEQIRHRALVIRDGEPGLVDVADLVPGDIVQLDLGDVVPADVRLLSATAPAVRRVRADRRVGPGREDAAVPPGALADCAASSWAPWCAPAAATRWWWRPAGRPSSVGSRSAWASASRRPSSRSGCAASPAAGAGRRPCSPWRSSSSTWCCTGRSSRRAVLAGDRGRHHSPAAARGGLHQPGHRLPAARPAKVLVKRLVCIEDLGDIEVLFTDKTGTLTEGRITFMRALGPDRRPSSDALVPLGLVCTEAVRRRRPVVGRQPAGCRPVGSPATAASRAATALPAPGHPAVRPRTPPGVRRWSDDEAGRAPDHHQGRTGSRSRPVRRRHRRRHGRADGRVRRPATGSSRWPSSPPPAPPR